MSRMDRFAAGLERVTGVALRPVGTLQRLEEAELELRGRNRELQDLAYMAMDYIGGNPQEMKALERRSLCQRARVIHQQDPQYGGQINLMNEFVLGRGIQKPPAVDEEVQKVIDRFWEDPDNKRILTTHEAQVRFNTDLSIQSNVFPLVYDDGSDGSVKLGLLDHDTVEEAVRDEDKRLAVLYYFTKSYQKVWDPARHGYKVSRNRSDLKYYEEFRNVRDAKRDKAEGLRKAELPQIPEDELGRGRVLHVAINRTLEQAFGVPEIARTIRWLTAYNDLMRARVDMAKAAASIIGKRKLKGGAAAMQQLVQNALMATGSSAQMPVDPNAMAQAPRPGSLIEENDFVEHQAFKYSSGSSEAEADLRGVRGQLAVGAGWPDPYIGGEGGNLSTATQLELRVLKMVEARQQVLEDLIRTLIRRAIERAIQVGLLDRYRPMTPEEQKAELEKQQREETAAQTEGAPPALPTGPSPVAQALRAQHRVASLRIVEAEEDGSDYDEMEVFGVELGEPEQEAPEGYILRELDFQVSMPSPLRRSMTDLITAISTIAKTFDPNATNLELSRLLLHIALGEGMEVEDPGAAVERIFPEGYVDPAVAAALGGGQPGLPQMAPGSFTPEQPAGPVGADGQQHPNADNPYGAPMNAAPPELAMQQALIEQLSDRRVVMLHSRETDSNGRPLPMPARVQEAILTRARRRAQTLGQQNAEAAGIESDQILAPAIAQALATVASST